MGEGKLQYDFKNDLDVFRTDLERLVTMEIITRYYYQRGAVEQSLKSDKFLVQAVGVLDDSKRYQSILAGPTDNK